MVKPIRALAFVGCLLLLCLVACQRDPWAYGYLTGRVAEKDIVGTYFIDVDSRERAAVRRLVVKSSARIVLAGDHRAEFVDLPEDLDGHSALVTGRGTWRIDKNDGFTTVLATIVKAGFAEGRANEFGYVLQLYGKGAPYKLHLTIGDPESGDVVQFEKRR